MVDGKTVSDGHRDRGVVEERRLTVETLRYIKSETLRTVDRERR